MAVTDIVADNGYTPPDGDGAWAECGIGALQHDEVLAMITSAGLVDAAIDYTHWSAGHRRSLGAGHTPSTVCNTNRAV